MCETNPTRRLGFLYIRERVQCQRSSTLGISSIHISRRVSMDVVKVFYLFLCLFLLRTPVSCGILVTPVATIEREALRPHPRIHLFRTRGQIVSATVIQKESKRKLHTSSMFCAMASSIRNGGGRDASLQCDRTSKHQIAAEDSRSCWSTHMSTVLSSSTQFRCNTVKGPHL